jgi:ribosomal protein S18 acetylase RimI-like enzyme
LSGITLRRAVAADVPVIHAMLRELAAADGVTPGAMAADLQRHGFGARPLFQVILAEAADEALGMVLFYPDFSTLRGRPGVMVQDLFIAGTARRRGLGRRLLAAALAAGADWEAAYLTLMVERGNVEAQGFYRQIGFQDRGSYASLILEGAGLERMTAL